MVLSMWQSLSLSRDTTFDGCSMIILYCFVTGDGGEWFCQCGDL